MNLIFSSTCCRILPKTSFLFIVLNVYFLVVTPIQVQSQLSQNPPPSELTKGWQYRWGDSPLNDARDPVWIYEDSSSNGWKSVAYKKGILNPPGRNGEKILWLRIKLGEGKWRDPHIFVENVLFACEVYLGAQRIYQTEGMADPSNHNIIPFWHMIPIAFEFQNIYLFFRIYSEDPSSIGIEQASIGSSSDFIKIMLKERIQLIIFGFLFIATGMIPLLIFIKKHEGKAYFAFGLFAISMGIWALSDSIKIIHLFFKIPEQLFFLVYTFIFLAPVGLCLYFEQIFGAGFKSIIRRLWQIHLIYAATSLIIMVLDLFPFTLLLKINLFFFILFFVTLIVLLTTSIIAAIKGRTDARIITVGFIVFALLGIYDIIGGGFGLIPSWTQVIYPWGMLVFILTLGIVLERRFSEAHEQLQEYSKGLEIKVTERTQDLKQKNETLENTLEELKSTQSQLVQSEKIAALGKLTAGVAHEINNPLGALKSTMDILSRCVNKLKQIPHSGETPVVVKDSTDFQKSLNILEENSRVALSASDRISRTITSLKNFARLDEAEFKKVDIHEGIESTLTLIEHEVKEGINVIKEYGDIPQIYCYAGEINQVFMTLLTNAVQAIEDTGTVTIKTFADKPNIIVRISDTGVGIPPDKLKTLFDFSFTTKKSRVGMGMGLLNAYNIIQRHKGEIKVGSEVGKGTTFKITLPINQNHL